MKRRIAVFTSTRADYGLLRSVILDLHAAQDVELQLLVSGGHLAASQGMTIQEIEADSLPIAARIDLGLDEQPPLSSCTSMARALEGTADCLARLQPHMLVILGDRYEATGAALAATLSGIPLAHISGGDITEGAVDDVFRHSITKMSHLHFPSCEVYRHRVIQLGEAPERVWNVGALGVENVLNLPLVSEPQIRAALGLTGQRDYVLCTFHPVTLEGRQEKMQLSELLAALEDFSEYDVVFTGANADHGSSAINNQLQEWADRLRHRARLFASLGVLRYLSAAKYAACVVGNSSSGVVEIPSLKTPVLDIGSRQQGRIRSPAVLHCQPQRADIVTALRNLLSPQYRTVAQNTPNPYKGEHTAQRICHILKSFPLDGILHKKFYDLPVIIVDNP